MKLRLERTWRGPVCTIGTLTVDGQSECFTLEDVERGTDGATVESWKIKGETAIPLGTYAVTITHSERFGRDLPLVLQVPGFSGIRIHPGNTAADTEGCILVGRTKGPAFVGESRAAFNALFPKIKEALDQGDSVTLEVASA